MKKARKPAARSAASQGTDSPPALGPRDLATIQTCLPRWFRHHQRDLPWRKNRDPYRIWVSEVLLQQTQVATVIPFFERFLTALPRLADLAAASEQQVLRLWEGLGYYRRALHLHRAARHLMTEHGGQLPDDPAIWRGLPGVGRYMVGAILSQAFDRHLPIVEANSQRVLCRLFGQKDDPRKGPTQRWLWQAAESLIPQNNVGEFNQALMELGALVCTPSSPNCPACPLAKACVARRQGLQDSIPLKASKPKVVEVSEVAVVMRRGPRVLLVQRPDTGRWARMWEFPHGPLEKGEFHEAAAQRIASSLTGIRAAGGRELATLRHGITHYRITMVCFEAKYRSGKFRSPFYQQGRWLEPDELHAYPVSAPQRRLAQTLVSGNHQKCLF